MTADRALADVLALPQDAAYPRVVSFARRFGEPHLTLAMHAAFPLGLSPELLHLLRINLVPVAPFIAEADLLLSALCREAGDGLYEMDAAARELLLEELVSDPEFGPGRLFHTAGFVLAYAERTLQSTADAGARRFLSTQRWAALAQLQPERASGELMDELSSAAREGDTSRAIRLVRITDALSAPLAGQRELTAFAASLRDQLTSRTPAQAAERPAPAGEAVPAPREGRRFIVANVVVLGDSGVGKTGLSMALAEEAWQSSVSSHDVRLWTMGTQDVRSPDGATQTREIFLRDFPGQPVYRMLQQRYLQEASVALIVVNTRSETGSFSGARYWVRALAQARSMAGPAAVPLTTFLVAARADRGLGISRERIRQIVDDLGLDGFFDTSAFDRSGIAELAEAIRSGIAWDELPAVIAAEPFDSVRRFLLAGREAGPALATTDELFLSFTQARPDVADDDETRAAFKACIGRLDSRGLIHRLFFGDLVLLRPERLDGYASLMLQAARMNPDGLGFVRESDALDGRLGRPEGEGSADPAHERLMRIAAVEELLRQEIALKETTDEGGVLIFPSEVSAQYPGGPDIPGEQAVFIFQGPLPNIYAGLAVRLAHSGLVRRQDLWRDAAFYATPDGGSCGIQLLELEEGRGALAVFYDEQTWPAARRQFEAYVAAFLEAQTVPGTLIRRQSRSCPACGDRQSADLVQRMLDQGRTTIYCPNCGNSISLLDGEPSADTATVAGMNRTADERRDRDAAAIRLTGKRETDDYDVFFCYSSRDREAVIAIGERLKERGILPWLDVWETIPGMRWQEQLDRNIGSVRSAAVFIGSSGLGPWQNQETGALLGQLARRSLPIIPVILEGQAGTPHLPAFLSSLISVDMRNPAPDPFEQLIWGITGIRTDSGPVG